MLSFIRCCCLILVASPWQIVVAQVAAPYSDNHAVPAGEAGLPLRSGAGNQNRSSPITPIPPRTQEELAAKEAATNAEMLTLLTELDDAYAAHSQLMQRIISRVPSEVRSEIQRSIDSVKQGRREIHVKRQRIIASRRWATDHVVRSIRAQGDARVARSPGVNRSNHRPLDEVDGSNRPRVSFEMQLQNARDNAAQLREIRSEADKARESFRSAKKP